MVYDTDVLIDDNGEFIYFEGKVSKFIYSKKNNSLIGANITSIELVDKFYKTEFRNLIDSLQNEYFNLYKKKIPREYLIIFSPLSKNEALKNYENLKLGFPVRFKVLKRFDKTKKRSMFSACDTEYYKKSVKDDPPKFVKQLPGIYTGKTYISLDDLNLKSDELLKLLDNIAKRSSIDEIFNFNSHIKVWLFNHIQQVKKQEYERECKILEEKKKREYEETSNALAIALDNIKNCLPST